MDVMQLLYGHRDNGSDRGLGRKWEAAFCTLAARFGRSFTAQQIGRVDAAQWFHSAPAGKINPCLLPDVTIWTAPGEHHEIKHKSPTRSGCYGLEQYRLEALLAFAQETQQPVLYTIHDWQLAGASKSSDAIVNDIDHWRTVDVRVLADYITTERISPQIFPTYVDGRMEHRPGFFWPVDLWGPLGWWWS